MEENNFGYVFEHDDYGRFEQDIDQDTAYVIRPEQMGGGASPQPQIKRTIPIVTIALIVANVIAGIMCIGVDNYSRTGGLNYQYVKLNGEYGRLISAMFLHSGFDHLFGNMFALYMFGSTVERKLGSLRTTIIYFVSGIVAGIIFMNVYHMTDPDRMHFSIGASGAVFGIICAAVFLTFMGNRKASRKDMMVSIVVVVIYALYTNEKNIDIYAHVGGAIVGGILAFALNIKRWEKFRENKFCKLLAVILTLSMCVTGIGEAGIGKDAADLPDKRIDYIKEQKIFPDGDTTYGDGLDAYCSDEHWQAFVATDGSQIVQFEGNATYKGQQVTVTVQFQIEGDCEGYQPGYVGLNDVGQNSESATEFMLTVCGRSINELKYGR